MSKANGESFFQWLAGTGLASPPDVDMDAGDAQARAMALSLPAGSTGFLKKLSAGGFGAQELRSVVDRARAAENPLETLMGMAAENGPEARAARWMAAAPPMRLLDSPFPEKAVAEAMSHSESSAAVPPDTDARGAMDRLEKVWGFSYVCVPALSGASKRYGESLSLSQAAKVAKSLPSKNPGAGMGCCVGFRGMGFGFSDGCLFVPDMSSGMTAKSFADALAAVWFEAMAAGSRGDGLAVALLESAGSGSCHLDENALAGLLSRVESVARKSGGIGLAEGETDRLAVFFTGAGAAASEIAVSLLEAGSFSMAKMAGALFAKELSSGSEGPFFKAAEVFSK